MLLAFYYILIITSLISLNLCKDIILNNNYRSMRHCNQHVNIGNNFDGNLLINQLILVFLLIFGLLLFLIFVGIMKGLIGLICCPSVGMYGIALLIDLPRPLDHYEEKCLHDKEVIYDVGGWPLHPETLKRTVRVISKRTEFCLNIVFFLAYPLALLMHICSYCCCIQNYDDNEEGVCFKTINTIKFADCPRKNDAKRQPYIDIYREDDRELKDTQYVMNAARRSQVNFIDEVENCP